MGRYKPVLGSMATLGCALAEGWKKGPLVLFMDTTVVLLLLLLRLRVFGLPQLVVVTQAPHRSAQNPATTSERTMGRMRAFIAVAKQFTIDTDEDYDRIVLVLGRLERKQSLFCCNCYLYELEPYMPGCVTDDHFSFRSASQRWTRFDPVLKESQNGLKSTETDKIHHTLSLF